MNRAYPALTDNRFMVLVNVWFIADYREKRL